MKQNESRKENARRLLRQMIAAGVNRNEMVDEIGCSRWMLYLWLKGRHTPSPESYERIERAHSKFVKDEIPSLKEVVAGVELCGVDVAKALKCTRASVSNWKASRASPQARYRSKLVELYERHVLA